MLEDLNTRHLHHVDLPTNLGDQLQVRWQDRLTIRACHFLSH